MIDFNLGAVSALRSSPFMGLQGLDPEGVLAPQNSGALDSMGHHIMRSISKRSAPVNPRIGVGGPQYGVERGV